MYLWGIKIKKNNMNTLIVKLSRDKAGLLARVKTMPKDDYWHIHSDELSSYQKRIHKKLLKGWIDVCEVTVY